jgi:CysZ protein
VETYRGQTAATGTASQFFAGVQLLGRGLAIFARNPGLLLLGLIPAAITGALFLAGFGLLLFFISDLARLVTWFADDWSKGLRDVVRFVAAIGILGMSVLLAMLTFTALTLLIGDPFYEKISGKVEERFGGVPNEVQVPWWRSLARSLGDTARMVLISIAIGIPLFFVGFIPVVGQIVVPIVGAAVGGWFLAVELVGVPFARRGLLLADRRRLLRANRPLALGFGVSVFVCFLIPLGAVLVMPVAVAGGTLLARRVFGLPYQERA